MNRLERPIFYGVLLLIAQHSLLAQAPPPLTCNASAAAPPIVRAEGRAELVSDIVLTCTGGNPTMAVPVNISIFLNTNITSNLTGPGPDETEALTLIDEPMPAPALNTSNGFPFVGQVKGISGVAVKQNQPGVLHCTESGFNPDFTPVAAGNTRSANTGTRLAARITGIPGAVTWIIVPNNVGLNAVPVMAGSAMVVYEVVAGPPYAGMNGCVMMDTFVVTLQPWPMGSLANAIVSGFFAPLDPTPTISALSPEPRFR